MHQTQTAVNYTKLHVATINDTRLLHKLQPTASNNWTLHRTTDCSKLQHSILQSTSNYCKRTRLQQGSVNYQSELQA